MSENHVHLSREVPVREDVDVCVVGGGPAGVAAAVAAARTGAQVRLAEACGCFGGAGTAALVPGFCQFGDGVQFLAAGVGEEILKRLRAAGGTGPDDTPERQAAAIRVEVLKRVYDELVAEAVVKFSFYTMLTDVAAEAGNVTAAIFHAKSGFFAVRAKVFVDATGDGDLAVLAGADYDKGNERGTMQPGTLCSLWSDIDWPRVKAQGDSKPAGWRPADELERAFADGVFTQADRHLSGIMRVGRSLGGGNIGHAYGVDGTDERSLTEAMVLARRLMPEFERFYKNYLEGYEHMELAQTGHLLGIRESRRIAGDYQLNLDDFKRRATFEDEIGRYCYPVDIHPSSSDKAAYDAFEKEFHGDLRYKKGESYGIPYRTLLPKGLHNVLVAGRCISTDRYVQGSVRVMPGCYITGQAAGAAAALAAQSDTAPRELDTGQLRDSLRSLGAYVP